MLEGLELVNFTSQCVDITFPLQRLRNLENQLDKANLKSKEAEHIGRTYLEIKMRLEEEHQTFETTLDDMEVEIKKWVKFSSYVIACIPIFLIFLSENM